MNFEINQMKLDLVMEKSHDGIFISSPFTRFAEQVKLLFAKNLFILIFT